MRSSDRLFGRTVATYQWVNREVIRQAIQELSSLEVHGIDKRIHQVMYERGYLQQDQIYAVLESLLQSKQLSKMKLLITYEFTQEDDQKLYTAWKLPFPLDSNEPISELPPEVLEQKLPIPPEDLLLCLNIKHSLNKAGISLLLLRIICDKRLLSIKFKKIIPDLLQRKRVIIDPEERNAARIQRSIALLFCRIGSIQGCLQEKNMEHTIFMWQTLLGMGVDLRYSELLFFLRLLDEPAANRIADTLLQTSGIDQKPRLPLIHLTEAEEKHFHQLVNESVIPAEDIEQIKNLWLRVQQEGLKQLTLAELMIIQGKLTRKEIAQAWADVCKKTIANEVKKVQMEHTEEMVTVPPHALDRELVQTEELVKQVEAEEKNYAAHTKRRMKVGSSEADQQLDNEIEETFQRTQEQRMREMHENAQFLESKLQGQDHIHARSLHTVIAHYSFKKKISPWTTPVILGILIFSLTMCIVWLIVRDLSPDPLEPQPNPPNSQGALNEERTQKEWELAQQWRKTYQYSKSLSIYQKLLSEVPENHPLHEKIKLESQQTLAYQKLLAALNKTVQQHSADVSFTFRNRPESQIREISPQGLTISLEEGKSRVQVAWHDVAPEELYQFLKSYGIVLIHPWETAQFCAEQRLVLPLRESLAAYLNQYPTEKKQACTLLNSITQNTASPQDYLIYQGALYTRDEMDRLTTTMLNPPPITTPNPPVNPNNPVVPPPITPPTPTSTISWSQFDSLQTSTILTQREEYHKSQQAQGKVLAREQRWSTQELADFENLALEKQQQNQVYFVYQQKPEWITRDSLGQWYLVTLRKSPLPVAGFLLPSQNIYEFRTNTDIQYLSNAQIISKVPKTYPWDQYWQLRSSTNTVLEHIHLAQWAASQNLSKLAQIEWEQVLMLAPQNISARRALGYLRNQNKWIFKTEAKPGEIYWENQFLPPIQAKRMGLVLQDNQWQLREDVALLQWKNQNNTRPEPTELGSILGKNTVIHADLSCQADYNFSQPESIESWTITDGMELADQNLIIKARGDFPKLAYWKAPIVGDCTITTDVAFSERPANNLLVRLYCTPDKSEYDGYLICLAHSNPNDPQTGHWIKAYSNAQGELLGTTENPILVDKRPFKLIIKVIGDRIEVHLNKQRLLRVHDKKFRQGYIGIGGWRSSIQTSQIQIQGYIEPKWHKDQAAALAQKQGKIITQWQGISSEVLQTWDNIPNSAWQLWKQERLALLRQDFPTAWILCQTLIKEHPNFALALLDRAYLRLLQYDFTLALDDCQAALRLQSWDDVYQLRAKIYALQGQYDLALKDLSQTLSLNPQNLEAHYNLVQTYLALDRKNQALANIQKLSQELPQEGQALRTDMERVLAGAFAQPKFVKNVAHYEISGEVPEVFGEAVAYWVQQIYNHYQKIYGNTPNKKSRILIFSSRENLLDYANLSIQDSMLLSNAYWWPQRREILVHIAQHPLLWSSDLLQAITQEWLAEQPPLPVWISQGLLTYGTYCPLEEKQWTWHNISPYWRNQIKSEIEMTSSAQVLASLDAIHTLDQWWQFHIQSYGWIYCLIHGSQDQSYWQEGWKKLKQTKNPTSRPKANVIEECWNISPLDSAYREYWKRN